MKRVVIILLLVRTVLSADNNPEENLDVHDPKLFEGDMILTPLQRRRAEMGLDVDNPDRKRGSGRFRLWPRGVVIYEIEPALARISQARAAIRSGMNEWIAKTCIRFKRRTNEAGYVYFKSGPGCSSYVGRTGKLQNIILAKGCWHRGIVAHEIGHAVGFYHEQSRPDRDNYVTIVWANIPTDRRVNFRNYGRSRIDSLGSPYDYGSVLHYGSKAFSKNGQPTILVKQSGAVIGQRRGLSATDAQQANLLYKSQCRVNCLDSSRGFCQLVAPSCRFSSIVRLYCKRTCNLC